MGWQPVPKPWTNKPSSQGRWQDHQGWNKWTGPGGWTSAAPQSLPADFEVDKDARYTGTVISYYKWSGYGFIKPSQAGVVPNDRLYVHWSNIQTDDRYPLLLQDMEVEFGVMKTKSPRYNNMVTLRAKTVTMPGGSIVALQDEIDAQKKTFVGAQNLRYTGSLKFYSPKKGFGYVIMDDGYATDEPVPKELKVEEQEVSCGGRRPQNWMESIPVEFGIWKNHKGVFLVYNMTLPGGAPMVQENLENRQVAPGMFRGTVHSWNWTQGWGFIVPDEEDTLPQAVLQKVSQMQAEAQAKGKAASEKVLYFRRKDLVQRSSPWLKQGDAVSFQIYTDDKGAGACGISVVGETTTL